MILSVKRTRAREVVCHTNGCVTESLHDLLRRDTMQNRSRRERNEQTMPLRSRCMGPVKSVAVDEEAAEYDDADEKGGDERGAEEDGANNDEDEDPEEAMREEEEEEYDAGDDEVDGEADDDIAMFEVCEDSGMTDSSLCEGGCRE